MKSAKFSILRNQDYNSKKLNTDLNLQFERIKNGLSTKNVSFHYAGRPRFINLETEIKDNKLILSTSQLS